METKMIRLYRREGDLEWCFNIETGNLSPEKMATLKWLLVEAYERDQLTGKPVLQGRTVEIGPRLNFETAWSSNAVNIARNCGLGEIVRIERSRRYRLKGGADAAKFAAARQDLMTECVYEAPLSSFALDVTPQPVYTVPILKEGIAALRRINEQMGLGMDEADLKYYYHLFARVFRRNPTNVEGFGLGQGNSEHSRHPFFNGVQIINGKRMKESLMDIVKSTLAANHGNSLVAFSDNSSVQRGFTCRIILPEHPGRASRFIDEVVDYHPLFTAETHNFPSGVAPFPGAETGTGGRIRDVQATGRGGLVIAGTVGYCVGNLHLPGYHIPGEPYNPYAYPRNLALPLKILIDESNGASDYGNKFGEPVINGFLHTFGLIIPAPQGKTERREWLKPIMFTGGLGQIDDRHLKKREPQVGWKVVRIGGPAYPVGFGGGARSSVGSDEKDAGLDFNAVQRGDAEMEQKMNRVIRACIEMGDNNPIEVIHDQGAGGPYNLLSELVDPAGGRIDLRQIQLGDKTMPVIAIVGAEYQEGNALLIKSERLEEFLALCEREKVNCEVLGEITGDGKFVIVDSADGSTPVDLDLKRIFTGLPRKVWRHRRLKTKHKKLVIPKDLTPLKAIREVFRLPSVGSKGFLVNKVDRSVSGLVARQQCCGPALIPVADFASAAQSFHGNTGYVTAIGEQPLKMLLDPKAGSRMAVGEMLTNITGASITDIRDIKCSLNWMGSPKLPGEGAKMYDAAVAMRDLMVSLGIAVDGGKDSLSMHAKVGAEVVKAPLQMVVSGYVTSKDVTRQATPDFKRPGESRLILIDMSGSNGKLRLGGSALAQALGQLGNESPDIGDVQCLKKGFAGVQDLHELGLLLAYHDVSGGGLVTTLAEMAMAGNCGLAVRLHNEDELINRLFAEELGAVIEYDWQDEERVEQILRRRGVSYRVIGRTLDTREFTIWHRDKPLKLDTATLRKWWEATSDRLEREQMNPKLAREQAKRHIRLNPFYRATFEPQVADPSWRGRQNRPRLAIIREEGSNGDREMAGMFHLAGFDTWDVNMKDLIDGSVSLDSFRGVVFVGGFSYADVLGSAKGWAGVILHNSKLKKMFDRFYERPDTFSLGVCNGCQLMAQLGWVPWKGLAEKRQPRFIRNLSGRFESRFSTVKVRPNPSIMLGNMEGSSLGIWVAHGEGRAFFPDQGLLAEAFDRDLVPLVYVDDSGAATELYPDNPNGSPEGIAALCSEDGRHLAMMPHPERTFLVRQWPWLPEETKKLWKASPWFQMALNAREWCERQAANPAA